jgi:hypothetical protein
MDNPPSISTPKAKPWSKKITSKTLAKDYGVHYRTVRRAGGVKRILAIPSEEARRLVLGVSA